MKILFLKLGKRNERGFTLIELLVVISIISLLASVVLSSLGSARGKGRDAQRAVAIKQVQNALELYYDNNGRYPTFNDVQLDTSLTASLVPTYISKLPIDSTGVYRYHALLNPASWYAIYMPYEKKPACFVCGGDSSACGPPPIGYWSVSMCK